MPQFRSLNDLARHLQKQINESLKEDVSEVVVKTMQRHIQEDVYDVYTPVPPEKGGYVRQKYDGGLIDRDNIKVSEIENGIAVQNMRVDEETGKYIAYTVETGTGYDYEFPYSNKPRPFTENTREELKQTGAHAQELKKSLQKKGLDVK